MSRDEIEEVYQGIALFMVPNSDFEKGKLKGKGLLELFGTLIFSQKGLVVRLYLHLLSLVSLVFYLAYFQRSSWMKLFRMA